MEFKLSEANFLSLSTKAFILSDPKIGALIGKDHSYFSIEKAMKDKSSFSILSRQKLKNVLLSQYNSIFDGNTGDNLVVKNIELLEKENTFTVTTGQQLHLFIGPAFVIYKILAVIQMTEDLRLKYPNKHFIPVYWLASEDHDFEEIKNTNLLNHNYTWQTDQIGPCGRFRVNAVADIIIQIKKDINLNESNLELLEFYETVYNEASSLSEATIKIIHHAFSVFGLVCIDGDNVKLKESFINHFKNDIIKNINIDSFNKNSAQLVKSGFNTQLNARNINTFYLNKDGRNRIEYSDGFYKVLNTEIKFTEKEISEDIENNASNYSPNALLRPIYQECILPNICYIGGNAEVNYWLQIHNLFKINNIIAPALRLRPSVWIIPCKIDHWLKKQSINPLELLISQNKAKLIQFIDKNAFDLEAQMTQFLTLRKEIQDAVYQSNMIDLKSIVELGKQYEKELKSLSKQFREINREKNLIALKKLETNFDIYFDIKQLQERTCSALEMLIKHYNVVFSVKNQCNLKPGTGHIICL